MIVLGFFYVHFWACLPYNLWVLREIAQQNSHHVWSNVNALWLNILSKNIGFVPPFGSWCNWRHSWILPPPWAQAIGARWGAFFFSVFFARTDRGQRNDYRSHCSGDAVSSQLHLGHAVPKLQGTSDCTEGITLLFTAPGQSEQGENVSFWDPEPTPAYVGISFCRNCSFSIQRVWQHNNRSKPAASLLASCWEITASQWDAFSKK